MGVLNIRMMGLHIYIYIYIIYYITIYNYIYILVWSSIYPYLFIYIYSIYTYLHIYISNVIWYPLDYLPIYSIIYIYIYILYILYAEHLGEISTDIYHPSCYHAVLSAGSQSWCLHDGVEAGDEASDGTGWSLMPIYSYDWMGWWKNWDNIYIWATVKNPAILNMYSMDIGLWKLMEIVKNTR